MAPCSQPISSDGSRVVCPTRLAAIWSELLGFDGVGVHDNFFELGGDSMLAVRLMAEVEHACGRKLPLACCSRMPPSSTWRKS